MSADVFFQRSLQDLCMKVAADGSVNDCKRVNVNLNVSTNRKTSLL